MQDIQLDWEQAHRLIPSHFPPISVFEDVADNDEFDILYEIESLTNDRLLAEVGDIAQLPPEERIFGSGSTPIMAAFTHIGIPSRFTNGEYGVYYAANTLSVAIAETQHHHYAKFMADTQQDDCEVTMRQYITQVVLPVVDVTDDDSLHLPDDYSKPQTFGKTMREQGVNGLLYRSVRHPQDNGLCVALFRPKASSPAIQGAHFRYVWSGKEQRFTDTLNISKFST